MDRGFVVVVLLVCHRVGLKQRRLGREAVARTPLRVKTGASFASHEESIVLHVVREGGGVLPPAASHFTAASAQTVCGAPWRPLWGTTVGNNDYSCTDGCFCIYTKFFKYLLG